MLVWLICSLYNKLITSVIAFDNFLALCHTSREWKVSLNRGSRSAENVGILEFFVVTVSELIPRCLMTVDEASVTSSLILTPFLLSDSTARINPIFSMRTEIIWVSLLSTI